ncbi:hypothetical protein Dimus_033255 [Dionaea muscipula]
MHTAARKEFYANLTVFIYKRKEIARSRVRGVEIEFDKHEIGLNSNCSSATPVLVSKGVDKQREDPKRYDYFEDTFLTMCKLKREDEYDGSTPVKTGESGSDDQFFDAQVDVEEPVADVSVFPTFPASPGNSTNQQREQTPVGVDPWGPSGHIPESVMIKSKSNSKEPVANRIKRT